MSASEERGRSSTCAAVCETRACDCSVVVDWVLQVVSGALRKAVEAAAVAVVVTQTVC